MKKPIQDCAEHSTKPIKYDGFDIYLSENGNGFFCSVYHNGNYVDCTSYKNDEESAIWAAKNMIDFI